MSEAIFNAFKNDIGLVEYMNSLCESVKKESQYAIITANLKKWITTQNISNSTKENTIGVIKLISELCVTHYDCKPFGSGENGEPYGGTHEIRFTFGDCKKYICSYEEKVSDIYGCKYQLTIDGVWISTNYPIKKGTVSMSLEEVKKWPDAYKYMIEICKNYKMSLTNFLLIVGIIGDCFYNI